MGHYSSDVDAEDDWELGKIMANEGLESLLRFVSCPSPKKGDCCIAVFAQQDNLTSPYLSTHVKHRSLSKMSTKIRKIRSTASFSTSITSTLVSKKYAQAMVCSIVRLDYQRGRIIIMDLPKHAVSLQKRWISNVAFLMEKENKWKFDIPATIISWFSLAV